MEEDLAVHLVFPKTALTFHKLLEGLREHFEAVIITIRFITGKQYIRLRPKEEKAESGVAANTRRPLSLGHITLLVLMWDMCGVCMT